MMVFRFKPHYQTTGLRSRCLTSDYHVHSHFSPDAHHSIDQICQRALDLGLRSIAVTDHVEWRLPGFGNPEPEIYFQEIYQAQEKYHPLGLTVLSGIEVGNPQDYPRKYSALLSLYPFEVIIASQHWLGEINVHEQRVFQDRDPQDVYRQYFQEMRALITLCDFDILAHPDRIFWPGIQLGAPPRLDELELDIRAVFAALVATGKILELNTKYLMEGPDWKAYCAVLLDWYRDQGGEHVVVNSDAHQPAEMARHFLAARELLEQAGIHRVVEFAPRVRGAVFT